jgi:WhiB family redox-sensing transcriptional regulator
MEEWLPDFAMGMTDEVGPLPAVMTDRISMIFGKDTDHATAMKIIRGEMHAFSEDPDDEHNFSLFFSGYALDDIYKLGVGDVAESMARIHGRLMSVATNARLAPAVAPEKVPVPTPEKPADKEVTKSRKRKVGAKATTVVNGGVPVKQQPSPNAKPAKRPQLTLVPLDAEPFVHDEIVPLSAKTLIPMEGIPGADSEDPDRKETWQEKGLCSQTDPELFFPEKGGSTREAKSVCLGCEVIARCLQYALDHDERFGIWGGLSERERRRLKRGII